MKKLILLTITAFALFSCNNGEDDLTQERTKSVVVQFAPSALSRAVGTPVEATDKAEIKDYTIFFLDAADNVVAGTKVGTTAPGTDAVACPAVGATAASVYVVANTGSTLANIVLTDITPANKSTLATIKAKLASMDKQQAITSVVLANSSKADNGKIEIGAIVDGKGTYTASVQVAPVICRLEIGQICGTGNITGFKLEGIYIDGHAVNFNVGGGYDKTATGTNTKEGIYSIGVDNSQLAGYPTNFCDVAPISATGSTGDFVAKPTEADKVWAYQLAAGAPMPKIIVKLSGVNGGTDTKYVTVTSYKNVDAPYSTLVPGTVYKIDKISFKMENTAEVPNATEKNVSVTVEVKNWDVVTLTPEV